MEGPWSHAMQTATTRARRIQILWVASHVVAALLCALMAALSGRQQLELGLLVILWVAVWSSTLEYAMSCKVHDTMDIHVEAGHTPVRQSPWLMICSLTWMYPQVEHSCIRLDCEQYAGCRVGTGASDVQSVCLL